jgi:hypothetical protein
MLRKADMPPKLTTEIITAAIEGFESQKTRLDIKIAELKSMLPGGPTESPTLEPAARKRRKMSAAARARIAEAQRLRWAKAKGEAPATPEPPKPKRKLSAATRAKLVANLKKARAAKVAKAKAAAKKEAPARKKAAAKKAAAQTAPPKAATA